MSGEDGPGPDGSKSELTRRDFLISSSVVVVGTLAACGGGESAGDVAPDAPEPDALAEDAIASDTPSPDITEVNDSGADVVEGGGGVEPERPFIPELTAPAGSDDYSDGNVAFQLLPADSGGLTAIWVGGHDRRLELTVGTPSSDGLRFHRPREPEVELDLLGFLTGRLQQEIRTLFGDSVLLDALVRAGTGFVA